ncbi:hypothetical protein TNCV_3533101 [Trichonephila clavipes]|nr:hypothetical protein TNCV_3533101 [Trichonephila clavipes]
MLKHVQGSDTLLRMQIFEWHQRFRKGRESVKDDERSGRPKTSRIAENIEKFSAAVQQAHQLQGRRFQSANEGKRASQAELQDMAKNEFQKCVDDLYKQCYLRAFLAMDVILNHGQVMRTTPQPAPALLTTTPRDTEFSTDLTCVWKFSMGLQRYEAGTHDTSVTSPLP